MIRRLMGAAILAATALRADAQSDSYCANAADSARIIRTGPVRTVAWSIDGLRMCLTADGFKDSTDFHPRIWATQSRILVYETVRPGDARRMETSVITTTWTRNGRALAYDSVGVAWLSSVRSALEAHWELVTLRQEEAAYNAEITNTARKQKDLLADIENTRLREKQLNASIASLRNQDRQLRASVSSAQRQENDLRNQLSQAQSAVASAQSPQARQAAEQRVRTVESQLVRASENLRTMERRLDQLDADRQIGNAELELKALNPENRITLLGLQLADFAAEERFASLRAALTSLDADNRSRKLEIQLAEAVAKLNAILK